uniref:Enoyl reductase (ER) domain-containing protein n=1 Tax=Timema cristinae TaxID=61476 RepID=A0A7R9GX99_TIMCR|nr:unnamed protein product [Timema cristinae]
MDIKEQKLKWMDGWIHHHLLAQHLSRDQGVGDLGHLELSGVTNDGTRFMSVVQNKAVITEQSLDPYLTWEIPEPWSMEDAATVPLAYATAYHGMIQAAELSSFETVLIHAGHTSIGQAAIALALHKGSTVFTTVAESNHKELLIKRFPQLQENNILSQKSNFDISLMRATKGVGVKVIVNCLRGSKLQSSLQCVAECGRFVQLGTADMEENTSIGKSL